MFPQIKHLRIIVSPLFQRIEFKIMFFLRVIKKIEGSNGRLFFHFQVMEIGLFNVTRGNHFPLPVYSCNRK